MLEAWPSADLDAGSHKLSAHGRGVDAVCLADGGEGVAGPVTELSAHGARVDAVFVADGSEGVACLVATRRMADVVFAQLPHVRSTLDAASLEVSGDGPAVNAKVLGEIRQ